MGQTNTQSQKAKLDSLTQKIEENQAQIKENEKRKTCGKQIRRLRRHLCGDTTLEKHGVKTN